MDKCDNYFIFFPCQGYICYISPLRTLLYHSEKIEIVDLTEHQYMTLSIKIQNVNDDRNTPATLPKYALSQRIESIIGDGELTDIIALNEISINNLDMIARHLSRRGYSHRKMAYAPNQVPDRSFYHVLAWNLSKKENYEVVEVVTRWFTATPAVSLVPETRVKDPILMEYKEQFEKGTLCVIIKNRDTGKHLILSMNHFGLMRPGQDKQYTNKCAQILAEEFAHLRGRYRDAAVIAAGDFNAFTESTHIPQLCHLADLYDITPVGDTFCNYPWDLGIMRPETKDRILAARTRLEKLTGADYVSECIRTLADLYGGPLKGPLDKVLVSKDIQDCEVRHAIDFSNITLAYYSEVPFAPSDHSGFIVTVMF